ncbi:hypothetical protein PF003_g27425 [Phytophthora fragariae]|nr:hypothetical protein PF003_g27425 [Phytophthora fragariae]
MHAVLHESVDNHVLLGYTLSTQVAALGPSLGRHRARMGSPSTTTE